MTPIVVEQSIVEGLGAVGGVARIVPRRRARSLRSMQPTWRAIAADAVAEAVADAPNGVVLARRAEADPGAAALVRVAAAAGLPVVLLPDDQEAARWCTGVATALGEREQDRVTLRRVLEVLCAGPATVTGVPTREWGPFRLRVPALRPATLARWAGRVWAPCSWCRRGGAPGHVCRHCGGGIAVASEQERP